MNNCETCVNRFVCFFYGDSADCQTYNSYEYFKNSLSILFGVKRADTALKSVEFTQKKYKKTE